MITEAKLMAQKSKLTSNEMPSPYRKELHARHRQAARELPYARVHVPHGLKTRPSLSSPAANFR